MKEAFEDETKNSGQDGVVFLFEHGGGHQTHLNYLKLAINERQQIAPTYILFPTFHLKTAIFKKVPSVIRKLREWISSANIVSKACATPRVAGVFFHTISTAIGVLLFSKKKVPYIASIDITPFEMRRLFGGYYAPKSPLIFAQFVKKIHRILFKKIDMWICFSEWAAESLKLEYSVPDENVRVCPAGVDTKHWSPKVYPAAKEAKQLLRLLFVGGDFDRKGGNLLLELFRQTRISDDCLLNIVCSKKIDISGLRNVRIHSGLSPNCEALVALYAESDVFVLPTVADCSPFAILEAAASALPVISSRIAAIPEQVIHEKTGFLIAPGDEKALADSIYRFVREPNLLRQMGLAGRALVEERFDMHRNYIELVRVVEQMTVARGPKKIR